MPTVVRKGYLVKEGGIRKSWKRRFFVLDSLDKLKYFKEEGDAKEAGSIDMTTVTRILCADRCDTDWEGALNKKVCFGLETPKRTYHVYGGDLDEVVEWLLCLKKAARIAFAVPLGDPLTPGNPEDPAAIESDRLRTQSLSGKRAGAIDDRSRSSSMSARLFRSFKRGTSGLLSSQGLLKNKQTVAEEEEEVPTMNVVAAAASAAASTNPSPEKRQEQQQQASDDSGDESEASFVAPAETPAEAKPEPAAEEVAPEAEPEAPAAEPAAEAAAEEEPATEETPAAAEGATPAEAEPEAEPEAEAEAEAVEPAQEEAVEAPKEKPTPKPRPPVTEEASAEEPAAEEPAAEEPAAEEPAAEESEQAEEADPPAEEEEEAAAPASGLIKLCHHVYSLATPDEEGCLGGDALKPLMLMSELEPGVLGEIWNLVDDQQAGKLDYRQLGYLLGLMSQAQRGEELDMSIVGPDTPPPNLKDLPPAPEEEE